MKCHFSIDVEAATGVPTLATDFFNKLGTADLLVISFEHNGAYSAAFKIF
jgi:NAD(P)H-dependent FMN reductase